MFGVQKQPLDKRPYPKSPDSRPLTLGEVIGQYVYVVDPQETIHVVPDGSHQHPRVLGQARPALYAGEISIDRPGSIEEVTNNSGTFQFTSQQSLCCVATSLRQLGFVVNAVRYSPPDGSRPLLLSCL